jgi:hypothetical protein
MFCVMVAADRNPTGAAWTIPQVFEFIAFPADRDRAIEVVALIVATNAGTTEASLRIVHRGAVDIDIVDPSKPISFPECNAVEHRLKIQDVLWRRLRINEDRWAFRARLGSYRIEENWVPLRPSVPRAAPAPRLTNVFNDSPSSVPFTCVDIDNIPRGVSLLALRLVVRGDGYDTLIGSNRYDEFVLNGPRAAFSRINGVDLPRWIAQRAPSIDQRRLVLNEFDSLRRNWIGPHYHDIWLAQEPVGRSTRYSCQSDNLVEVTDELCNARGLIHFVTASEDYALGFTFLNDDARQPVRAPSFAAAAYTIGSESRSEAVRIR